MLTTGKEKLLLLCVKWIATSYLKSHRQAARLHCQELGLGNLLKDMDLGEMPLGF